MPDPRALIADDEPFYHEWLIDYLETKNIEVDFSINISSAIDNIIKHAEERYRFIIVDLSIPIDSEFTGDIAASEPAFVEYPGLYIADFARNNGYRGKQVIVYSVHISETIEQYVSRLYCTYLPKGRPGHLKEEISSVLSYDPHAK
jgi:hypothetical protein